MEVAQICAAIELMGREMTPVQAERTMSEIKENAGQTELAEIEHVALMAISPIYADLRCFRAESNW